MFRIRSLLITLTLFLTLASHGQITAQTGAMDVRHSDTSILQSEDNRTSITTTAQLTNKLSLEEKVKRLPTIILGQDYSKLSFIFNILFIGAIGILCFFVIVLLIKNRDPLYLYYALFMVLCILEAVIQLKTYNWHHGISSPMTHLSKRTTETFTMLAFSVYCLFAIRLLDIKRQDKKLYRFLRVFLNSTAIYGILYWLIYPLAHTYETYLLFLSRSIILPTALVGLVWVGYRTQSVFKNYFILGSLFYFVGSLLSLIRDVVPNVPIENFYQVDSVLYFQVGIFLDLVIFALAITHRLYLLNVQEKKDQKVIQERISLQLDKASALVLSSQMQSNPHFIFNSLSSIKYLVQSNQNERAINAINLYSKFIRKLIETGEKPYHSLNEEMELIRLYIKQELNRFGKQFHYSIVLPENSNFKRIQVPPLFLLPYVEEIIWQSVARATDGDEVFYIKIQEKDDKQVAIYIEETKNNTCYPNEIKPTESNKDLTRINNERLKLFNKNSLTKIRAYVSDEINNINQKNGRKFMITIKQP